MVRDKVKTAAVYKEELHKLSTQLVKLYGEYYMHYPDKGFHYKFVTTDGVNYITLRIE